MDEQEVAEEAEDRGRATTPSTSIQNLCFLRVLLFNFFLMVW